MRRIPERGVTLIDTLVGSALMLVVFLGIAAAFELSVEVVTNNKSRAGAIALANERMEYLKSLTYTQIGVVGGIPAGNVPQLETSSLNGVSYTRRTLVLYTDDPEDGLGAADTNSITADFKTIRVEVSWESRQGYRSVELISRVSPAGIETAVPGGTLTINVVNASNAPLANAQVQIVNASTSPIINITTYTGEDGSISFIGAPAASNYQVVVTKGGYSTAQTYPATPQNPNPTPRHLTVSNNQTTSATFAIDVLGSKTIETYRQLTAVVWTDAFDDALKIATSTGTEVSGGRVRVAGSPPYPDFVSVRSVTIAPASLTAWKTLSWQDVEPADTQVLYRLYTGDGSTLIPDAMLPGNSAGFATSSIDISGVSTTTYPSLSIGAQLYPKLQTGESMPSMESWSLSYTYGPEPLPNFTFTLRGNKTIGNSPTVYKYNQYHTSDSSARIVLPSMEWDTYTIGVTSTSTLEIAEACAAQPQSLAPGESQTTRIYLLPATSHSVLVDVKVQGGAILPGASVRVQRSGYDVTEETSSCGQAFFSGLSGLPYDITVSKTGYQTYTQSNFNVNGDSRLSVELQPL